jgi:hypothetical protein
MRKPLSAKKHDQDRVAWKPGEPSLVEVRPGRIAGHNVMRVPGDDADRQCHAQKIKSCAKAFALL